MLLIMLSAISRLDWIVMLKWLPALLVALAIITTLRGPILPVQASSQVTATPGRGFRPGVLLVKLRADAPDGLRGETLADLGSDEDETLLPGGVRRIHVAPGTEAEKLARIKDKAAVEYAELDYVASAGWTPSDPQYANGTQWGLQRIGASTAWDRTRGDGIVVAEIDTGVDLGHPDLAANAVAGFDFVNNTTAPWDDNGHGTHVAGIIAAIGNNGIGGVGAAPTAKIMPLKVLDSTGSGYYSDIVSAIRYAADRGVKVINMSFGGAEDSQSMHDAVDYAWGKGTLLVAAAGNDGTNANEYPAAYSNVMAVAATDSTDHKASFSNYGRYISVAAPGVAIYSTLPTAKFASGYGFLSGTSMAAPYVSAVAALAFAGGSCQNASNSIVRQEIESAADNVDGLNANYVGQLGHGRLNAARSVPWPATLTTSTNKVNLLVQAGDAHPQQRTIGVSTGGCAASWTATVDDQTATWLTLSPDGASQSTLNFTINASNLPVGHYTAGVTLQYSTSTSSKATVAVDLAVAPQAFHAGIADVRRQAE